MTQHLEQRVSATLADELGRLDPHPGDLAAVRRRGGRIRTWRRVAATGAVVAVVAGFVAVAGLDGDRRAQPTLPLGGVWTDGAAAPISPRWGAVGVWTGDEALFVGGGVDTPCPPNADCTEPDRLVRDGAAYDPHTDTWRRVAPAPVDVGYWFRPVAVGGLVVMFGTDGRSDVWLAYDIEADRWTQLPDSPRPVYDQGSISALDGEVYVLSRGDIVQILDPASGEWRELPPDDVEPRLEAESVIATPEGVFVTGPDSSQPDDGATPRFVSVDRWDGERWTRLGRTGQIGSGWHWTGERLINPDPQVAPGLTGEPPFGGVFDPAAREWSALRGAPDVENGDLGDGWSVSAADGPLLATWSSAYDDRTGEWTRLGQPLGTPVDTDQAAVWADDRLVVFGGIDEKTGYTDVKGLSNDAWIWTPEQ